MPTLPAFRTVVNEFGVSPSVLTVPIHPRYNVTVPIKTYSYWFWCLASLTLDYTYQVNQQSIHQSITVYPTKTGIQERIIGTFAFVHQPDMKARPTLITSISFPIALPADTHTVGGDDLSIQKQHVALAQQQPLFCAKALLPLDHTIRLCFMFTERQGLSTLCTHPEQAMGFVSVATYQTSFMDQPLTLHLMGSKRTRQPITGSIQSFSITPEFYTFEEKKS